MIEELKDDKQTSSGNSTKPFVRRGGTFAIAWGRNGGFGYYSGFMKRLCLWRVAIYYLPEEIEDTFKRLIDEADARSHHA